MSRRVSRFDQVPRTLPFLAPRTVLAACSIFVAASIPTLLAAATDEARRRIIDEACPTYERDDMGSNGVMSSREVRCRLDIGKTYNEIAADIAERQKRKAAQQQSRAEARRAAKERAESARKIAMGDAADLCLRLVQDYKDGRWFVSGATAPTLLTTYSDAGPDINPGIVEAVTAMVGRLGHNFTEADERAFALAHPQAGPLEQLENWLDTIRGTIERRASRAQDYEQYGRNDPGPVRPPPSTKDYAFACFMQQQFGSIKADPWNRGRR